MNLKIITISEDYVWTGLKIALIAYLILSAAFELQYLPPTPINAVIFSIGGAADLFIAICIICYVILFVLGYLARKTLNALLSLVK